MYSLSQFAYLAGLIALAGALSAYAVGALGARSSRAVLARGPAQVELGRLSTSLAAGSPLGTTLTAISFAFLTACLGLRWVAAGHGPFASMYEFSIAFAWAAVGAYLFTERRYGLQVLALFVLPVALAMLFYAGTLPSDIAPLVPALQNDVLLTLHVAVAVAAYAAFAVAFGAGLLYLLQDAAHRPWLPSLATLDEVGYRAVAVGFPMMALVLLLGALWAEIAWGSYWSWDAKETATLVTWLLYGGYLHARVVPGWRGRRSALLLILGFAAVLFTYFGNYFLGGQHSYA